MYTTMRWHLTDGMEVHLVISEEDDEADVDHISWQLKPKGIGNRHLIDRETALALINLSANPVNHPYKVETKGVEPHLTEHMPGDPCPHCTSPLHYAKNCAYMKCENGHVFSAPDLGREEGSEQGGDAGS
jgi:hypothetical protein